MSTRTRLRTDEAATWLRLLEASGFDEQQAARALRLLRTARARHLSRAVHFHYQHVAKWLEERHGR